ncbi:MAG: hypothetical protein K0R61_5021 [Microvirga sp.]|nr:hypothetical protein [Microvirga sp.]
MHCDGVAQRGRPQCSASMAGALSVELRARFAVQRPLFSGLFCFRVFGAGEVPRHFKHHSNGRKPARATATVISAAAGPAATRAVARTAPAIASGLRISGVLRELQRNGARLAPTLLRPI